MRYYIDGKLSDGLQLASENPYIESVEGEYHIVWIYYSGKRQSLDWTNENLRPSQWTISFQRNRGRFFTVLLHFDSLKLEYTLCYKDSGVIKLQLSNNLNPDNCIVDDRAFVGFSAIRDEQDYPYMKYQLRTNAKTPNDDVIPIEFVAKRTDAKRTQLGLKKNEKLSLGYAVLKDGTFESDNEITDENPIILTQRLDRHLEALPKLYETLVELQKTVDKQIKKARNDIEQAKGRAFGSSSEERVSTPNQGITGARSDTRSTVCLKRKRRTR